MSMASVSKDHCLICWNTLSNAALTMPCLHRFCYSCIRWWAEIKPECPLCRGMLTSILYSLPGEKFKEFAMRQPSVLSHARSRPYSLPDARRGAHRGGQDWRSLMASTESDASQGGGWYCKFVPSTSAVPTRGGTPEPGPAPSATDDADELLARLTAALQAGPSCAPAPIPGEQEEMQTEPGEAAAPVSAARRARCSSRRGPRRALKRKASNSRRSRDFGSPAKMRRLW